MAVPADTIHVPLAILIHGALEIAGSGLEELTNWAAKLFAALPGVVARFIDGLLLHSDVLMTSVAAGAAIVLLAMLVTKAAHHCTVTVSSSKAPEFPTSAPETKNDLKSLPLADLEKKLGSSPDALTQAEAEKRPTQYGPNEIEEKKTNVLLKILSYFWGPIPWMIEVAVILSGVVRHWADFFIILILLVSNAAVGFFEERQAGNAIEALKARLAVKARVKRDGEWVTPSARELVPGDAIRLR